MGKKIKITLVKGCWAANIGNAFIDMGSIASLEQVNSETEIHTTASLPIWLFYSRRHEGFFKLKKKYFKNYFSLINKISSDYVVFSGMVLSEGFIDRYRDEIINLKKRRVKIIVNGEGARIYNENEVEKYRNFLREIKPFIFISRDEESFRYYNDLAEYSYNGIDCGFFVSDAFTPSPILLNDFKVHTFNRVVDPLKIEKLDVICTHHFLLRKMSSQHLKEKDTMISDQVEDYLNLYANAKIVYSDRVQYMLA